MQRPLPVYHGPRPSARSCCDSGRMYGDRPRWCVRVGSSETTIVGVPNDGAREPQIVANIFSRPAWYVDGTQQPRRVRRTLGRIKADQRCGFSILLPACQVGAWGFFFSGSFSKAGSLISVTFTIRTVFWRAPPPCQRGSTSAEYHVGMGYCAAGCVPGWGLDSPLSSWSPQSYHPQKGGYV